MICYRPLYVDTQRNDTFKRNSIDLISSCI